MTDTILAAAQGNYVPPVLLKARPCIPNEGQVRSAWTTCAVAMLSEGVEGAEAMVAAAKDRLIELCRESVAGWHFHGVRGGNGEPIRLEVSSRLRSNRLAMTVHELVRQV